MRFKIPRSQPRLVEHPYGYCYQSLSYHRWWEMSLLFWEAGSSSKPHCHQWSFNLTRVISGTLLERKYRMSGGQLKISSERIISKNQWAFTLPFQVHELIGLDPATCSFHAYFPAMSADCRQPVPKSQSCNLGSMSSLVQQQAHWHRPQILAEL